MSEKSTETTSAAISAQFERARAQRPAYKELYPFLEALFLAQLKAKSSIHSPVPPSLSNLIQAKWAEGFPALRRWEFPIDVPSAETVLRHIKDAAPSSSHSLKSSCNALEKILDLPSDDAKTSAWRTFLTHGREPWMASLEDVGIDMASLLFLARGCLRPCLEAYAEVLLTRFSLPQDWQKGYCPICGSLPSLLFFQGEGERKAHCSWCATRWSLFRLQCPYCDNRNHESLGYVQIEEDPAYRVQYCKLCKHYFKLIDTRELLDFPYLPLEEWKTLHLDLIAQQLGWIQAPSPSPVVYPEVLGE